MSRKDILTEVDRALLEWVSNVMAEEADRLRRIPRTERGGYEYGGANMTHAAYLERCTRAAKVLRLSSKERIMPEDLMTKAEVERWRDERVRASAELADAVNGLARTCLAAMAERDNLRSCQDPLNGDAIAWCGECGAPMRAVRPGKAQCDHCEERERLRADTARDDRREVLSAMGATQHTFGGGNHWVLPDGTKIGFERPWNPADKRDDVRLVEAWLRNRGHETALVDALGEIAIETLGREAIPDEIANWMVFAAAKYRWAACRKVMRDAGLIGKDDET